MYETLVTIVGNVTADPVLRSTKDGRPAATFRVASTARRYRAEEGRWVDSNTNFISVGVFNALAANVVASVHRGQPVVVYGQLKVRKWSTPDGRQGTAVEIDGYHVGHDLNRGTSLFAKGVRGEIDPSDRLADAQVRADLDQLAGGDLPAAPVPLSGPLVPVDGSSVAQFPEDDEPFDDEQIAEPDRDWAGLGDPETDDYIVAQAG